MSDTAISESVQNYYGQVLKSSEDLKTSACCTLDSIQLHLRPLLSDIHPEVVARYYGCGTPLPPALEGCTVLDLGCGTGRDCYLLSRLVGESGHVIGVDMTEEQLVVAKTHCDWHAERYGWTKPLSRQKNLRLPINFKCTQCRVRYLEFIMKPTEQAHFDELYNRHLRTLSKITWYERCDHR